MQKTLLSYQLELHSSFYFSSEKIKTINNTISQVYLMKQIMNRDHSLSFRTRTITIYLKYVWQTLVIIYPSSVNQREKTTIINASFKYSKFLIRLPVVCAFFSLTYSFISRWLVQSSALLSFVNHIKTFTLYCIKRNDWTFIKDYFYRCDYQ
jgi:hypothetical protein